MKFGVRECCDVVLRAKGTQKVGNKIFYKNEPVCYFDTLKTSSLEGAATTVYAQGGRGNARLMSWDGERTLTWTMEDALISPIGLMILTGAGLIEAGTTDETAIVVHTTEQIEIPSTYGKPGTGEGYSNGWTTGANKTIKLSYDPYDEDAYDSDLTDENHKYAKGDYIYVMRLDSNGDIATEPFIATRTAANTIEIYDRYRTDEAGNEWVYQNKTYTNGGAEFENAAYSKAHTTRSIQAGDVVLVDYYRMVKGAGNAYQVDITPDKFGGSYYLEASTLFRNEDGIDMPAEFIIPNCRIQSNFTFTMASSGDPSSFTFTVDCFPDYIRFDRTKKVLAAIQVITEGTGAGNELMRLETNHHGSYVYEDKDGIVHDTRFEAAQNDSSNDTTVLKGVREGQVDGYASAPSADAAEIVTNPAKG